MALTGAGREAAWETALSLQGPWAGQAAAGATLCDLLLGSVGQGRGAEAGYRGAWPIVPGYKHGGGMPPELQATAGAPTMCWPWG